MKRLILLPLFLASFIVNAQTRFQVVTGSASNDRSYHLASTADGGLLATGYTQSVPGNGNDAFLVRYNSFGEMLWAKTYGDTGDETTWDVISTLNGNIVTAGHSSGVSANKAGIISRLDSAGNIMWSKGVHSTLGDVNYYRVMETSDLHLVAAGLIVRNAKEDILISKFSPTGNLLWNRIVSSAQDDEIMGMTETSEGDYIFAGLSSDVNGFGGTDFAVVKTDSAGNVLWKKLYGSTSNERLNSVIEVMGSYYFLGWSNIGSIGGNDMILMKTDSVGNPNWVYAYGTAQAERVFNMMYDPLENAIITAGYTDYSDSVTNNRNTYLANVDLSGNLVWAKSYGGNSTDGHWPTGMAMNNDRGYYVLGSTNSFGPGSYSLYLTKTDTWGNTACNQKNPQFSSQQISGWTALNFGSDTLLQLSVSNTGFTASTWSITSSTLCCSLYNETGPDPFLCQNDTITLGMANIPYYNYSWTKSGNPLSSSGLLNVIYGDTGTYHLTVSSSNPACSASTKSVSVSQDSIPQHGLSKYYSFCPGDSISIAIGINYPDIEWYSLTNSSVAGSGQSISFYGEDNIEVRITTFSQCLYRDTIYLEHLPQPAKPVITHSGDSLISGSIYNNQWYYNGQLLIGDTMQVHKPVATGYYHVEVSNSYGCTTASDSVYVAFEGINNVKNKLKLSVYPNPASSAIKVHFSEGCETAVISLLNIEGKVLTTTHTGIINEGHLQIISTEGLSAGHYILSVETPTQVSRHVIQLIK